MNVNFRPTVRSAIHCFICFICFIRRRRFRAERKLQRDPLRFGKIRGTALFRAASFPSRNEKITQIDFVSKVFILIKYTNTSRRSLSGENQRVAPSKQSSRMNFFTCLQHTFFVSHWADGYTFVSYFFCHHNIASKNIQ